MASRSGRSGVVKNRAPAPIQITAEQLLREARERQTEGVLGIEQTPTQQITNEAELAEYQIVKRKEYEDDIRRQRQHMGTYMKYAKWEEKNGDLRRARSIFERALDVDYKTHSTWLRYAEMEMRNKNVNHARNIWDRAIALLPRIDQFWYKYTYMEEMLGKISNARLIFERWMRWEPCEQAWFSYIKLEERCGELDHARDLYERYCACHPTTRAYVKYAKWEERHAQLARARSVFERSAEELTEDEVGETIFIAFAHFEERCKELDRARAIYKYALDRLPQNVARELYQAFITFEKQHGDRKGIEDAILDKRRAQYEEKLQDEEARKDYDVWFDYIRLEETEAVADAHTLEESADQTIETQQQARQSLAASCARVRDLYERAISNVPPLQDKHYWQRYIYLWINYALFEELHAAEWTRTLRDARKAGADGGDGGEPEERTSKVYEACLKVVPHERFTFSKIWVMLAHYWVRRKELDRARRVLGLAIGRCPKEKIFKQYIQLELQLGNVDRCRTLYGKYLEFMPENCFAWAKYAELEESVGEEERCRALYELAVKQPYLDMPEVLWKKYIDFEVALGTQEAHQRASALYERLLERTQHVKVWVAFAQFSANDCALPDALEGGRDTFMRGYEHLKAPVVLACTGPAPSP